MFNLVSLIPFVRGERMNGMPEWPCRNADGSMQIRQAIVEPDLHMEEFESLVFGLGREVPRVFCTFRVAGENHSSTAGGDGLVSIEADNTSISECTYMAPFVANSDGS